MTKPIDASETPDSTSPPKGRQLRDWFDQAIDIPADARDDWIEREIEDAEVRAALHRMLAVDAQQGPFDASAEQRIGCLGEAGPMNVEGFIGTRIGAFRIERLLGQGGMATVFLGHRDTGDFDQQVALKLLRRGLYSDAEQRLFRREQRALATLSHPNIAHLLDGGITPAGVPYLVIEYIDGSSITEFATARALAQDERLRLFTVVCDAVRAAHRALIVHRDLKPSNIFVDRDGNVKLLDFGIAKLLDDEERDLTGTGHVALTPGYAAPEQYTGAAISTATDVYALGVVLHELLTGERPRAGLIDTQIALRGDLGNIVLKALSEEPERRYASAHELALDIGRFLGAQPVAAHPPSNWYRARKFVDRHRGGVLATGLFLVAIVSALGIAVWQAQVARNEAQRATSVRDFLLRVFSAAEPAGPRLAPPSVVDIVRISILDAQQSKTLNASVRIELLNALGNVLREQGQLDESVTLLEENHRSATTALGPSHMVTLHGGMGLARALANAGKRDSARTLLDELLTQSARVSDSEIRSRLLSESAGLAVARFERERAFDESAQAVALCMKACSEPARILSLLVRGSVLANFQQDAEAIAVFSDAMAAQRAIYFGPHVEIASTAQSLSRAYRRLGQLDRAEAFARESLAIVDASVDDPHLRRSGALDALRQVLIDTRQFDEAERLGAKLVAMNIATLGADHPRVATSENSLGFTFLMASNYAKAAEHFRSALEISERIPDNHRRSAIYRANLGISIGRNGDLVIGMQLIRSAIDALRALPEPDFGEIASALEKLGALQRYAGDAEASLVSYSESDQLYLDKLPDAPKAWRVVTLVGVGRAHLELGNHAAAAVSFNDALANETTPADRISPFRIEARAGLALATLNSGDRYAALAPLQQAQLERAAAKGSLSPSLQAFVDSVAKSVAMP